MRHVFKRFSKESDGSATVETVIWLPFLILFFVMTAEISNIFFAKTQMDQIVSDANRLFSVGVFTDQSELDDFVLAQLGTFSANATYQSTVGSQMVNGYAVLPVADVMLTGFFSSWLNFSISSSSTQYVEY